MSSLCYPEPLMPKAHEQACSVDAAVARRHAHLCANQQGRANDVLEGHTSFRVMISELTQAMSLMLCASSMQEQEKTDEVLDKDGWFHTGDIAEILPFGALKIIDRKKALFKLSQGEQTSTWHQRQQIRLHVHPLICQHSTGAAGDGILA